MNRGLFVSVAICSYLHAATAASAAKPAKFTPIKYPGPVQDLSNRYGVGDDDVPEACRGQNFCTIKPVDYPEAQFNAMFKGMKQNPQPSLIIEGIGDRQGDPEYTDNCDTKVTFEPLYKVKSKRGEWHTVIQAPEENYLQKVRLETCSEENASCFTQAPLGPSIITACQQKMNVWKMLVSDGNNGTEMIEAELPICCTCVYKIKN